MVAVLPLQMVGQAISEGTYHSADDARQLVHHFLQSLFDIRYSKGLDELIQTLPA